MASDESIRLKKLPEHLLTELLDKADAAQAAQQKRNRRKTDRLPFRKRDLPMQITHPGGGLIDCTVATRDLSPTGICFLYWNYLHTGTVCTLHLTRHLGGVERLEGFVTWCRHLHGTHHLVGLRFNNRISPSLFVDPSVLENADSSQSIETTSSDEKIFSQIASQPDLLPLIETFVTEAKGLLDQLRKEVQIDDFDMTRRIISRMKGSAGSFGFPTLSAAALDAMNSLDATLSVAKCAAQLRQVEDIGRRICSGLPETAPK